MREYGFGRALSVRVLTVCMLFSVSAFAQEEAVALADGGFEVIMEPAGEADAVDGVSLGRFVLKKVFTGDLIGGSSGEMLTARTATEGSAGYVAIERFTGSLAGRAGTFVLQHAGTMQAGDQALTISVVPDSGTGELSGIAGTFHLQIKDGKHFYELRYTLGEE